jgi:Family of unknown function (DUF6527)
MRSTRYNILATVERLSDAGPLLQKPGDCVIVERSGVRRSIVMSCPCACGELLPINLDPRSGKAWRLYYRYGFWTLFPSIDRDTGCRSHFILSRGRIIWCDWDDRIDDTDYSGFLDSLRTYFAGRDFTGFYQAAEELDLVPWDVLSACHMLVRLGDFEEGRGELRGAFRPQADT